MDATAGQVFAGRTDSSARAGTAAAKPARATTAATDLKLRTPHNDHQNRNKLKVIRPPTTPTGPGGDPDWYTAGSRKT